MKIKTVRSLLVLLVAAAIACTAGYMLTGTSASADAKGAYGGNYYWTNFDTAAEAFEAGDELNKEILEEGITLLKNENSLPLASGAKVSLFGKRSADIRYGGGGSGAGSGGSKITLKDSLERAGLEVNDELWEFYDNDSLSGTAGGALKTYGVYAGPDGGLKETQIGRAHV